MDTFFSRVKSKISFTMMQFSVSDIFLRKDCGLKPETEILNVVKLFCKEVGVHKAMIVDPILNQTSDEMSQFLRQGWHNSAHVIRNSTAL